MNPRANLSVEPLACADPLALGTLERDLVHHWLVWDAWVSGRRRVDLHPILLSASAHHEARRVAARAWSLASAAGDRAYRDPAERARYRLHADVERLAAAARAGGDLESVARVDLLLRDDGRFVACEVNADCPGGYNESLALPRLARLAGLRRGSDPTSIATRLADRLVERSGGPGSPRGLIALVYATGYAEDLQVCALLERLVIERGGRTVRVPPTALRRGGGEGAAATVIARAGAGPVSVLYRFYPIEYMAGQRNIDALVDATAAGALSSISSFASIYAQSKLSMARAWAHDPALAAEVFPETLAFADVPHERFEAERTGWVIKRDLSRVGDHVFVGDLLGAEEFSEIVEEVTAADAEESGQVWIAQRYIRQTPLATPWGDRFITLGVYLLDGAFAGYFARLSPTSHCSHDALVLPVFVQASERESEKGDVAA